MTERRIPLSKITAVWNDHRLNISQVAAELGICKTTLHKWKTALRLPPRPCHPRGRKWSQVNNVEFTRLWQRGDRVVDLARHFDRSPPTISKIARRLNLDQRSRNVRKATA